MLQDANLEVNDENIFIAGACKEKGIMFLQGNGVIGVRKNCPEQACAPVSKNGSEYTVKVNGKNYAVKLESETKATVNGKSFDISVTEGIQQATASASGDGTPVKAALPGNVLKTCVEVGDTVEEGDVLLVLEAMKMETEVKSPSAGTVQSVEVAQGDKVVNGQVLVTIG